ncbi:MAG: iron chelate uptake ABC transporter family permease subunit [Spirochaetia bacterium]|jgi:zinc transport system permease protein|nr:iron chelate uptake ABC transporter family permease subunit [Spirochaetia bacterium]
MDRKALLAGKEIEGREAVLEVLGYPPVIRAFVLLVISGFTFPLSGIFILRMNILPIRYLLMHGVLLGGALGLAFGWNLPLTGFLTNIILIILLSRSSKILDTDYGALTMFFMVSSIAAASIVVSRFNVPAKDTLTLLWGSLYSGNTVSIITAASVGGGAVLFAAVFFRYLTAIFHDRDIALSLGVPVNIFELAVMLLTSLVVASAMQLMGALLLDAQIILPVIIAGFFASGLKQTMILSSLLGGLFSIAGFFLSLFMDIPVSAGVALPAMAVFVILLFFKKRILK